MYNPLLETLWNERNEDGIALASQKRRWTCQDCGNHVEPTNEQETKGECVDCGLRQDA